MASNSDYYQCQVGHSRFTIDKRYQKLKPIGDGSYGLVASAFDVVSNRSVAIKKVVDTFADVIDAKRILREIKLLYHFNTHDNVISILDLMVYPPNSIDFVDIYIVTNLMESDLERIIHSKQPLTDQHYQYFLYQILRGLKYIHSANVLHRDLKPSNLIVNSNCDLALCDFGLARGFNLDSEDDLTEYVVTRWYRSPELLCLSSKYGKSVDMWSVGCIFAEILTQTVFFRGENPGHQLELIIEKLGCPSRDKLDFVSSQQMLDLILQFESHTPAKFELYFPRTVNPLALDLLYRMLAFHPDDRCSVIEALEHPYLREFHTSMTEPDCSRIFDFNFERRGAGGSSSSSSVASSFSEASVGMTADEVRYFMYEEMRKFRPYAPAPVLRSSSGADSRDAKHGYDGGGGGYKK